MLRQGDVLLIPVSGLDLSRANRIQPVHGRFVLADGEVTGHSHTVDCQTSGLFDLLGKTVLVVDETTVLTHQEHGPIEIAPGSYWVVRQREYTPQAIRRVAD